MAAQRRLVEPSIIVFADDLTGANDTGVQIAKRGIETVTLFDPGILGEVTAPAIVFDTESRGLAPDAAGEVVRRAVGRAAFLPTAICYKKIDSTLRGNIGAELAVLVEELSPDSVVCVPAYPKNGRTTRDGVHRVHGVPLAETEIAADPLTPVRFSSVTDILARDGGPAFHHLTLDRLRSPRAAEEAASDRFVSFDCEEQADLERIVALMRGRGRKTLWCGSAGLAEVLLETSYPPASGGRSTLRQRAAIPAAAAPGRPLLAVVGSASETTQRQLSAAISAASTAVLRLDGAAAVASFEAERARLASALEELDRSLSDTPRPRIILAAPATLGAGPTGSDLARVASRCLGAAAADYLERRRVAGLFLTGGQTAFEVAQAASVRGMLIERELSPGIPLVRFIGGALDGLPGVTKAGGFGGDDALVRSLDAIASLGLARG